MNVVGQVAIAILVAAALLASVRAVRSGTLGDRAVAFDTITSVITCGLLVGAAITGDGLLLELALVLGLLGFLTSVTVSRFIERRGG
jgi:multicomponent Na+:H+ antiporter subunit F